MRIVVMGTGPFAVPMFESLLDSLHSVQALITRPTPAVKGRAPINPMREAAERRGLPVQAPDSINSDEGRKLIDELAPDLLVVCDYGQILSADVLAAVPLGGVNLHASLLPKYRGAAPIQWALLSGDTATGITVIHMTARLDSGPILAIRQTPIGPDEVHPELEHRLAALGIEPVHDAINLLAAWDRVSPIGTPQEKSLATKAPRLKKEHGAIEWSRTAEQIRNQVRALKPWPGTFTFWQREGHEPLRLVIDQARVAEQTKDGAAAGQVVVSNGKQLVVATGGGGLSIDAIAPAGKRHMAIDEFLRGYRIREGDVFGSVTVT